MPNSPIAHAIQSKASVFMTNQEFLDLIDQQIAAFNLRPVGTCKDCVFWGDPHTRRGQKTCDGWTDDYANTRDVCASADDDSNLQAWLETGPDFGCTLFQPKPATHHE